MNNEKQGDENKVKPDFSRKMNTSMLNYTIPREFDPQIQDRHVTLPQDLPDY